MSPIFVSEIFHPSRIYTVELIVWTKYRQISSILCSHSRTNRFRRNNRLDDLIVFCVNTANVRHNHSLVTKEIDIMVTRYNVKSIFWSWFKFLESDWAVSIPRRDDQSTLHKMLSRSDNGSPHRYQRRFKNVGKSIFGMIIFISLNSALSDQFWISPSSSVGFFMPLRCLSPQPYGYCPAQGSPSTTQFLSSPQPGLFFY